MNKLKVIAGLISIAVLIYFRYKLSLIRYFDIDEFAHLNWAYSYLQGGKPYSDFFYIFPPYFLIFVSGVISIFGRHAETLLSVRAAMYVIQLLSYLILFLWARKMKNIYAGILTVIIFIFLPLPQDKLLEIRPDLAASVAALAGLYAFIRAFESKKNFHYFLSGF